MKGILFDQGLPRTAAKILKKKRLGCSLHRRYRIEPASDNEILEYARAEKRVIVTLDADSHAILAVANESEPLVVRIRQVMLSV